MHFFCATHTRAPSSALSIQVPTRVPRAVPVEGERCAVSSRSPFKRLGVNKEEQEEEEEARLAVECDAEVVAHRQRERCLRRVRKALGKRDIG